MENMSEPIRPEQPTRDEHPKQQEQQRKIDHKEDDEKSFKNEMSVFGIITGMVVVISGIAYMSNLITGLFSNWAKVVLSFFVFLVLFVIIFYIYFEIKNKKIIPKLSILIFLRTLLSILGLLVGIIISFSVFKPNREFIVDSYIGTKTPTFTNTPTETMTVPPTPVTPTKENPTNIPTPTQVPLFEDNFFDNSHSWSFLFPSVSLTSTNHILSVTANCIEEKLPDTSNHLCNTYFTLPLASPLNVIKDFYLEFSLTLKNTKDGVIGIQFRDDSNYHYYLLLLYPGTGEFELRWCNGAYELPIIKKQPGVSINTGYGEKNIFGLSVIEKDIKLYVINNSGNNELLFSAQDSNIKQEGIIRFGLLLDAGYQSTFEFDYVKVNSAK